MEIENKYGILLNDDIKLQRMYFKEMCCLYGINTIYRAPKKDKYYTTYAEVKGSYQDPLIIPCIFTEYPDQKTLKKIGWVSELQENASLIHVAYDTPDIQQGALFEIPSGLDDGKYRMFRVVKLSNIMVYPASITCEIVPEYENTYQESQDNFEQKSFNVLREEEYY